MGKANRTPPRVDVFARHSHTTMPSGAELFRGRRQHGTSHAELGEHA
jgi:hypothetical protein